MAEAILDGLKFAMYPLGPWNAWFTLSAQVMRMCWEAQAVMWLRGLRIAQRGARAEAETVRMMTEKVAALTEAQIAATTGNLQCFVGGKGCRTASVLPK
jgi:hypothetical protein